MWPNNASMVPFQGLTPKATVPTDSTRINSSHTKVYGPASSGRLRNAATCSSRLLAISLTWLLESLVTRRVATSLSTRRADTHSR